MRACIQRVKQSRVLLPDKNNECIGRIEQGFLVLLGVGCGDGEKEAVLLAKKICNLRVFEDPEGKMNLSLSQIGGRILVVSQFTLFANCQRGNRPSFTEAAPPDLAEKLYLFFLEEVRKYGIEPETGAFRQNMSVELINDGPITIFMDTDFL
ncbi:MAG: D-aminoacyl-tRNA deacylase [Planctomycetia bacterium]|nr:D-aminoacyl-tRNA deacylase [Planctomycetia bacterium]